MNHECHIDAFTEGREKEIEQTTANIKPSTTTIIKTRHTREMKKIIILNVNNTEKPVSITFWYVYSNIRYSPLMASSLVSPYVRNTHEISAKIRHLSTNHYKLLYIAFRFDLESEIFAPVMCYNVKFSFSSNTFDCWRVIKSIFWHFVEFDSWCIRIGEFTKFDANI